MPSSSRSQVMMLSLVQSGVVEMCEWDDFRDRNLEWCSPNILDSRAHASSLGALWPV